MRTPTFAALVALGMTAALPTMAQQQTAPDQKVQDEADKGAKTRNSGASGYVADQEKPGASAHPPGEPLSTGQAETGSAGSTAARSAPSAQNSGAGIPGVPGNESGPAVKPGTVGSSSTMNQENPTVRQQDPSNIQGLPGNKSGPPAKQPSR